ncbi:hypothetical protein [Maribellus sp. YY47]|uniref:hypothetical protein n=1 Tax=Maribellus sp. YY47 TaxID=2929486 RepID=UPI002000A517|nr:hypothetical protein [Maribellus sp. YY47]MCK3684424.1 hypothetical protein [Maribellus sp. YY47]
MKKLIIFTLLLIAGKTYAQSEYQISSLMDMMKINKSAHTIITEEDIEGSPYLNDEFITGTVYTTNKYQFKDIPLRYNVFNGDVEFKTPDNKILAIAVSETIEKVEFGDYTLEYIPYIAVKKVKTGYLLALSKGKISLYAKPEISYRKPTKAGAYKEAEPAKFLRGNDSFYIRIDSGNAQSVGNKKDLIGAFPDHQAQIEDFIKKNKIRPDKADELKLLVEFYNSL